MKFTKFKFYETKENEHQHTKYLDYTLEKQHTYFEYRKVI